MTSPGAALTALEAALTCRPGRWIRREGRSTRQIEASGRSRGQRERSSGLRRASTDPWEPSIAVRDGSPELRDLSSDQARRHRTRKSFGLAPQATKRPSTAGQNEGVLRLGASGYRATGYGGAERGSPSAWRLRLPSDRARRGRTRESLTTHHSPLTTHPLTHSPLTTGDDCLAAGRRHTGTLRCHWL